MTTDQKAPTADFEARKVQAYQQGFNDRMSGRTKAQNVDDTAILYAAYLQGWQDAGK